MGRWLLILTAAALGACGEEQPGRDAPFQGIDRGQQEAPGPVANAQSEPVEETLYDQLIRARNMPPAPLNTPAQHYFGRGAATFEQKGHDPITQDFLLQLAGPARQRFELQSAGVSNVFILQSAEAAWMRTPQDPGGKAYDPAELSLDAWMRWTIARFPWGWKEALEEGGLHPDPDTGRIRIDLEGPHGPFLLFFDDLLRPVELRLKAALVRCREWRQLTGLKVWMPHEWEWQKPWGRLTERFDSILDNSLFLDSAFRDPGSEPPTIAWIAARHDPAGPLRELPEEFGLVRRPALSVLEGRDEKELIAALGERGEEPVFWTLHHSDGSRSVAVRRPAAMSSELRPGRKIPAARWLRWSTLRPLETEAAVARMRATMIENGFEIIGPVWQHTATPTGTFYRKEFLLRLKD